MLIFYLHRDLNLVVQGWFPTIVYYSYTLQCLCNPAVGVPSFDYPGIEAIKK